MKLGEIAKLLSGKIIGPPQAENIEINGVSGIIEAHEGDITFISSDRYRKYLSDCKASCVIVKAPIEGLEITQLIVQNPQFAFARLLEYFYIKPKNPSGISKDSFISESAKIGNDVSIYPFSYISERVLIDDRVTIYPFVYIGCDSSIGKESIIYPNVVIREDVKIGKRVIIHSGSVIGSDGFGYIYEGGSHYKIPQVGGVIIEDDVEIGSNVSIDRATTGNTVIGKGTKIDNLVQIAHNVKIGKNSIIIAQVGIAGSTEIGDFVTLAGQVGIVDHVKIEAGTIIGAQSGITKDLPKGFYSGSPAIPHREWLKAQTIFPKLPELYKKMKELEEKIKELERRNTQ